MILGARRPRPSGDALRRPRRSPCVLTLPCHARPHSKLGATIDARFTVAMSLWRRRSADVSDDPILTVGGQRLLKNHMETGPARSAPKHPPLGLTKYPQVSSATVVVQRRPSAMPSCRDADGVGDLRPPRSPRRSPPCPSARIAVAEKIAATALVKDADGIGEIAVSARLGPREDRRRALRARRRTARSRSPSSCKTRTESAKTTISRPPPWPDLRCSPSG